MYNIYIIETQHTKCTNGLSEFYNNHTTYIHNTCKQYKYCQKTPLIQAPLPTTHPPHTSHHYPPPPPPQPSTTHHHHSPPPTTHHPIRPTPTPPKPPNTHLPHQNRDRLACRDLGGDASDASVTPGGLHPRQAAC